MSNLQKRRPPLLNILLLLCAATVTLATLKSGDGSTGRSQQDIEWHGEDRQRLLVQIGPLAGRLDDFDYGGGLMLRLQLDHIPEAKAGLPRWSMSMVTAEGELFALDGPFEDFGGEIQIEDNGSRNGELSSLIGRLCEGSETAADGCIPCFTDTGCALHIEVDLCHSVGDSHTRARVGIARDTGEIFELECPEDGSSAPCSDLNGWIDIESESSEAGLCPAGL